MKHLVIQVSGKVQGVFFRASAKETANKLNIKGFAQNQPDGSVCIEAEGDEENVKQFADWCRMGPPRAQVTGIAIMEGELKNYLRFEIQR